MSRPKRLLRWFREWRIRSRIRTLHYAQRRMDSYPRSADIYRRSNTLFYEEIQLLRRLRRLRPAAITKGEAKTLNFADRHYGPEECAA